MQKSPTITDLPKVLTTICDKTDRCLLADVLQLARIEKKIQIELIAHLAEIAQRKLHLDQGYASMFDYCRRALNLAEGEIWLRLQVSSRYQRFPELLVELAAGTISLTVAGKISAHLNEENKTRVIEACRGKSSREVDDYLCSLKPKPALPSSLRCAAGTSLKGQLTPKHDCDNEQSLSNEQELFPGLTPEGPSECSNSPAQDAPTKSRFEPLGEERYHLRCTVTATQRQKLERLAELLGIDNPAHNLAALLERAVDIALKTKDPAQPRRQKKKPVTTEPQETSSLAKRRTRNIPAAIKRAVFQRAESRCQFCSPDGKRCPQRTHLCIDHVIPFAQGGSNELENLQLLCSAHNLRKAERDFGNRWQAAQHRSAAHACDNAGVTRGDEGMMM